MCETLGRGGGESSSLDPNPRRKQQLRRFPCDREGREGRCLSLAIAQKIHVCGILVGGVDQARRSQ
jgi:hypothetical protein